MKNSIKKLLLLPVLFFLTGAVSAQNKTITGFITDSATNALLANVLVNNLASNKKTTTDSKGKFSLPADIGDMLFFTKDGYKYQSIRYSILMQQTLQVRMNILPNELPGVTVRASYGKYQSDSMKRLQDFNADMVSPKQPAVSNANSGAGVGINFDFLKKSEKSKRRAAKLFEQHEKDAYVRYRFPPELVTGYTGLHGDSLERFIQMYAPQYAWLREHTSDEDVFYYINDKIKVYYKRKED